MIMCSHFAPVMVVAAFFTFVRVGDTSVLRGLHLWIWIAFDADGCIGMGRISMAASLDAIVLLGFLQLLAVGGRRELRTATYYLRYSFILQIYVVSNPPS